MSQFESGRPSVTAPPPPATSHPRDLGRAPRGAPSSGDRNVFRTAWPEYQCGTSPGGRTEASPADKPGVLKSGQTSLTWAVRSFLALAAVLVEAGVAIPIGFRVLNGRFLLFTARTDEMIFGRTPAEIVEREPAVLDVQLFYVDLAVTLLLAMGVLVAFVTWFGLRGGPPVGVVGIVRQLRRRRGVSGENRPPLSLRGVARVGRCAAAVLGLGARSYPSGPRLAGDERRRPFATKEGTGMNAKYTRIVGNQIALIGPWHH